MFVTSETIREVHGIRANEKQSIIDFLQGAVYSWCKNKPDKWFSLRDFMGGENYYWEGIPLIALYNKHSSKTTAVKDAGKDGGWLLKKVIHEDKRKFKTKVENLIRKYKWIK